MLQQYHTHLALIWLHVVTVLGALGVLFAAHRMAMADIINGAAVASRIFNLLLALGLVFGLVAYLAFDHTPRFHMAVGIKLVLLLVAGAGAGVASSTERRSGAPSLVWRRIALVALLMASFLGIFLRTL